MISEDAVVIATHHAIGAAGGVVIMGVVGAGIVAIHVVRVRKCVPIKDVRYLAAGHGRRIEFCAASRL